MDESTGEVLALKLLSPGPEQHAAILRAEFARLARLLHPSIVQVHDFGVTEGGTPYFTMDLIQGSPLGSSPDTAEPAALAQLVGGVVTGLRAIHGSGLVHGDLKPENLLVLGSPPYSTDSVRIVDLGLSGPSHEGPPRGTGGYAAPEVVAGEAPSPVSDLFSLGVVLYRILARMPAREPDPLAEIIFSREARAFSPMPLRAAGVAPELERVVMGLLERDPSRRTPSAARLWEELEPIAARRRAGAPVRQSPLLARGTLVGREAELARLRSLLSTSGLPGLLTGPSGSGRSRLLRELAVQLEVEGGRTVVVSCAGRDDGGTEWVRRLHRMAAVEPGTSWDATLEKLAAAGCQLAALEDLHLASDEDLAVARTALSSQRPSGLLVLLSWKEPSPEQSQRFRDFLVLAHSSWIGAGPPHIALPSLDREQSGELTRLLLSGDRIPELEGRIFEATGGQPAWIEMALVALAGRDALTHDGHSWRFSAEPGIAITVPEVREYAAAGVRALDPDALRWLAALGVLGGEAAESAVLEISGMEKPAGEAVEAAGLAVRSADPGAVALAQPLLAARLAFEALDEATQRELHRRAAARTADHPLRQARHWLSAGEADEALRALEGLPGGEATKSEAWRVEQLRLEALRSLHRADAPAIATAATTAQEGHHFEDATRLWAEYAEASQSSLDRASAYLRIAECRRWISDIAGAESALDRLERHLAPTAGRQTDPRRRLTASLLNERSWIALIRGELAAAETFARRSLKASAAQDLEERFTAHNRLVVILPRVGKLKEAGESLREALRLAAEMKDEVAEARIRGNAVLIATLEGDLNEERRQLELASSIGRRHGLSSLMARNSALWIELLDRTGSTSELRDAITEGERLARLAGDLGSLEGVLSDAARLELRVGNLRRSKRLDLTAWRVGALAGTPKRRDLIWYRAGCRRRLRGRSRSAIRALGKSIGLMERGINHRGLAQPITAKAELLLNLGHASRAKQLLKYASESAASNRPLLPQIARSLALASVRTGDTGLADQARLLLSVDHELTPDGSAHSAHLEASAYLEFQKGNVTRAIELWSEAFAFCRSTERLLTLADGLADASRTLAGLSPLPVGARRTAGDWLREARVLYDRMEARGPLAAVLSDLVRLQDQDAQLRGSESIASRSERDVLHQVSEIINSLLDTTELLNTSLRFVCERVGADRGLIVLVEGQTGALDPVAQHGSITPLTRSSALEISTTVVRQVAQTGAVFRSPDAAADPRTQAYRSVFDFSLRSILCAPLHIRDAIVGTIYLQNQTGGRTFSDADVTTLESFANLIAIAIERSRYQDELRRSNESLVVENVELRREVGKGFLTTNLIGQSAPMRRIKDLVERYAKVGADVLVQGETGTGKELVARAIHSGSAKRDRPFLAINCAAMPEPLIEAELFGIESRVATGVEARKGVFELAEDGTVLLDEIGDMSRDLQARLLRVLQEREFLRVGGRRPISFRGRVIAATNADLQERVRDGRFREDLYYRVQKLVLRLPPLRERRADLPALARFFVERFCAAHRREIPALSLALLDTLRRSEWPGNVRELENYLERLLVMTDGGVLEPLTMPSDLETSSVSAIGPTVASLSGSGAATLTEALKQFERSLIEQAMLRAGGNQSRASRLLGIPEPTLRYRLRKLVAD